jgi:hypothetical protein
MFDLREQLTKLAELKDLIRESQKDIRDIEYMIKDEIITDRNYDLLKVDWQKLTQRYKND